jgi:hypothetical protein
MSRRGWPVGPAPRFKFRAKRPKVEQPWPFDPEIWHKYWIENAPEGRRHVKHCEEIAEAARIFAARQAAGMDIFDAAEGLRVPEMNRAGAPRAQLRTLYAGAP